MPFLQSALYFTMASLLASGISLCPAANPVPPHPTTKPTKDDLDGIEFSLARRDESYDVGAPIMVDAVLRNRRVERIIVPERRGVDDERNCVIVVHGPDGKEAPLTDFGQKLYERKALENLRLRMAQLPKDQTIENVLVVTKVYDLSRPGRYSIRATRYVYRSDGEYVVPIVSNTVEVVVSAK
ncbi:MAG: hypothetical protein JWN40_2537 [Phycisphaerales bacterium]|jgi:hypothetical protein|nr:hypothetical protein [Phycisphaerales bacterium]